MTMRGKAHTFGAHIDTAQIIPAQMLVTIDPEELGKHCMANNDPPIAAAAAIAGRIVHPEEVV